MSGVSFLCQESVSCVRCQFLVLGVSFLCQLGASFLCQVSVSLGETLTVALAAFQGCSSGNKDKK